MIHMKNGAQLVFLFWMSISTVALANTDMLNAKVNGTTIEYVEKGKGHPVVLVHGHISDLRVWEKTINELSKSYRVIAYTQRYYGNNPWQDNGENFTRETHITDLIKFIEHFDFEKPVNLITRSYGGYVGLHAISRRPTLFNAAVHFEPAIADHIQDSPGYDHAWRELTNGMGAVVTALESGDDASAALRFLEVVYRMPAYTAKETLPESLTTIIEDNGKSVAPYFRMEAAPALSCNKLKKITTPQLIVMGENTFEWFTMAAEKLEKCSSSTKLASIKGVNHNGIEKKTNAFLKLTRTFLTPLQ